jgi:MFS family permease
MATLPWADSVELFTLLRYCSGTAGGVVWISGVLWLFDRSGPGSAGRTSGVVMAFTLLGSALGPLLGSLALGTSLGADTAFDASLHTINISDLMVQPAVWRGSVVAATNKETGSWGAFTRKKMELMCQLFNLKYEDFSSDATMSLVLSNLITTEMTRYLINQFNAGTPVKEDDGRLMWVGSVPWTSIIGVPYP